MPSRVGWFIWLVALSLLGAGCSSASKSKSGRALATEGETDSGIAVLSEAQLEKRADAHAHFLMGLSHEQNQQMTKALEEYELALAGDPKNEALAVDLSRRYLQRKDYDKAIAVLKTAARQQGASGVMYARLSLVYLQQGNTNAAVDASRTAIKRDPGSIAGYQSLFHLYRALGQTNEARKTVEQASKQSKPDAAFIIDLAHLYLALDADQASLTNSPTRKTAKELLVKADGMTNTNIVSLQRLAQGFVFVGDTKRAAAVYAKMIKADPDLIGVREALAEIYLRDNDPKHAEEQLKEIIKDNPTNPQAYYFLGAIAYEERRFPDALENYRKALLLGLDTQQIYFDIASVQLALNKPREAIDYLERARKKFRQSFVGEFYSGIAYMRLKEYTNALEHFTAAEIVAKATESNRLTHQFYFELGAAHERAGKIVESVEYFQKCLGMMPAFAPALNYLGYMWAERGTNLVRAREMIEKAVKLDPTNSAYLDSLGWVLFKQGHAKEALEPIRKAVELNDEPDATLFDHLGDVYYALKQTDKAREAWRKSLELEPNKDVEAKLKRPDPPPGSTTRK